MLSAARGGLATRFKQRCVGRQLFSLGGPGSFAQFTELNCALHTVLILDLPAVGQRQVLTLSVDLDSELHIGALYCAGERGFAKLAFVGSRQILPGLCECKGRTARPLRGFYHEAPGSGDIHSLSRRSRGSRRRSIVLMRNRGPRSCCKPAEIDIAL